MINEFTEDGETFSAHDGTETEVDFNNCVIISIPRALTTVCSQEVVLFNERRAEFGEIPLYIASADSPEVNSMWLGSFKPAVSLPMLTMKQINLMRPDMALFFTRGYSQRATIYMVNGKAHESSTLEDHDKVRSFEDVLEQAKKLFLK